MPTPQEIADAVWAKVTKDTIDGAPVTALNLLRYTHGDVAHVQASIDAANQALTRLETDVNTIQAAVSRTETVTGQTASAVGKVGLAVNADGGGVWGVQITNPYTPEEDTSAASSHMAYGPLHAGDQALLKIAPHLDQIMLTLDELRGAIEALTPPPVEPAEPAAALPKA